MNADRDVAAIWTIVGLIGLMVVGVYALGWLIPLTCLFAFLFICGLVSLVDYV